MADPTTRLVSLGALRIEEDPLPAAEVRRLGDRRRRRQAAATGLAVAALVAVVGVGVSLVRGPAQTAVDPALPPSPSVEATGGPLDPTPAPVDGTPVPDPTAPPAQGLDPEPTPRPEPTGPREIPASYPLATGWPERTEPGEGYGLTGPNRVLGALGFTACGITVYDGPAQDRLRADWRNVEDFRARQLTTYADAENAVGAVAGLVERYRSCPREPEPDETGVLQHHAVARTEVGGESWAFADYSTLDGYPAMGLTVTHVIRLGRAVLVLTESGHGGVSPDREAEIRQRVDDMTAEATVPLEAMCRYTEAGC